MGYTTDSIGHIDIHPPLNEPEQEYLAVFAQTRHCDTNESLYAVAGNPAAELYEMAEESSAAIERYNRTARGLPGLWCEWVPTWSGSALAHSGGEKFYQPVDWMKSLSDHFLRPDALASRSGLDYFEHFTFDHVLDGIVAGSRRDNGELFLINVVDNKVRKYVLVPGEPDPWELAALPYQDAIDSDRPRRPRPGAAMRAPPVERHRDRAGSAGRAESAGR